MICLIVSIISYTIKKVANSFLSIYLNELKKSVF